MVDALIAVVIVSLMAAICVTTLQISRRSEKGVTADGKARLLLQTLVETTPRLPGIYSGKSGGLPYSVTVSEQKTDGVRLCVLRAEAGAGARRRHLEATRWCDEEAPL